MTTWADVEKGSSVLLGGKTFTVEKVKTKGKRTRVTVSGHGGTFTSEVKTKDAVTLAPLRDNTGRQQRWASKAEATEGRKPLLSRGDPRVTAPPKKAKGADWSEPIGEAEKTLTEELGARLIAESEDEAAGYYVPPVDVTTVHAHLLLFHGTQPSGTEADALAVHDEEHRKAASNATLMDINHWHTKKRRMTP